MVGLNVWHGGTDLKSRRRVRNLFLLVVSLIALASYTLYAQSSGESLKRGFQDPPDSARPRVWWHWMNGNVTWEGAQADMDWMKRVGIRGMQAFDAGTSSMQVVDKRLPYMSPGWKEVFR